MLHHAAGRRASGAPPAIFGHAAPSVSAGWRHRALPAGFGRRRLRPHLVGWSERRVFTSRTRGGRGKAGVRCGVGGCSSWVYHDRH